LDATPQRQLIDELRVILDRMHGPDLARLARLVEANPRSIHAPAVVRNIGKRRAKLLASYLDTVVAPSHDVVRARATTAMSMRGDSLGGFEGEGK
jgi:hypothetical protein